MSNVRGGRGKGKGPAGPSAQLGASTRARVDPKRTIGTANAVAAGLDLTRVGIISDRELSWIRFLAYGEERGGAAMADKARAAEEARRKALSQARTSRWTDTAEAREAAFVKSIQDAKDEAERRRVALDALHAHQVEEERLARVAAAELKMLKEDPRGRNAKSALMLHEAMKSRAEQVAFNESAKAAEAQESEAERNRMLMDLWGYTAEELQKRLATRERNMAEKTANLQMVLYQIQQRREARAEDKLDGLRNRAEAAEEAEEQAIEDAERLERVMAVNRFNRDIAKPELSKAEKLQQRVAERAGDEEEQRRHDEHLDKITSVVRERRARQQANFEARKQAGLDRFREEGDEKKQPKYRTQDRFETKGRSFLNNMADGDVDRVQRMKENSRREPYVEDDDGEGGGAGPAMVAAGIPAAGYRPKKHKYNTAEASAHGFTSRAEEEAYLAEMRDLPERLRETAAAEAAARDSEVQRTLEIRRLQVAEKREQARREVEQEREHAQMQRGHQASEDAKFRSYIEAQIPDDMDPVLRARALQFD